MIKPIPYSVNIDKYQELVSKDGISYDYAIIWKADITSEIGDDTIKGNTLHETIDKIAEKYDVPLDWVLVKPEQGES